jgi:hypothetical protein
LEVIMSDANRDDANYEQPAAPASPDHQEELLDEALDETFPASDPFEPPHVD